MQFNVRTERMGKVGPRKVWGWKVWEYSDFHRAYVYAGVALGRTKAEALEDFYMDDI